MIGQLNPLRDVPAEVMHEHKVAYPWCLGDCGLRSSKEEQQLSS